MSRHRRRGPEPTGPEPGDVPGRGGEPRGGDQGGARNGHAPGAAPRNGHPSGAAPQNGHAPGGASHNGHATGAASQNGHTPGAAPRNGHANGAAPRNGHANGAGPRNGHANGAVPRNGKPRPSPRSRPDGSEQAGDRDRRGRGSRARPASIADFARPLGPVDGERGAGRAGGRGPDGVDGARGAGGTDAERGPGRVDGGRGAGNDARPGEAGRATETTRIPAARGRSDAEGAVARSAVIPAQRDRSDDSGPHRPADRTTALPAVPRSRTGPTRPGTNGRGPVVPGHADGPPPARDVAPGRTDGRAPPPDVVPTARVAPVRPRTAGGDTTNPAGSRPTDRGTVEPDTVAPDTVDRHTVDPETAAHTTVAPDTADPDASAPSDRAAPAPTTAAAGRSGAEPDRTPSGDRLLGVDVARGVALFGIIAVHALVEGTDDGAPATNYLVFGGRSAALFALLAGVALAFMTGRRRVRVRRDLPSAAAMVAARAGVLLVIGLALGWTDPEIAAVILPYYAVMFLLAIPLLILPTGLLAGLTVVLVGAVPVLSQLVRPALPVPTLDNPHLLDLVTDPLGLLSELTLTGAYPAMTWLAYLAAGLVIGRLRLSSLRTAAVLLATGTAAALAAWGASWWLLGPAGGYAHIAAATPPAQLETAPTIADFVAAFPDGVTPTTTWWWLATIAPHSGTPLDLVQTIGSATAVLGAALLLAGITAPVVARMLGHVLRPIAAAGSMTLTLYVVSLLFMNSPLDDFGPLEGYLWQIGAALVIGTAWRRAIGRGPLEAAHVDGRQGRPGPRPPRAGTRSGGRRRPHRPAGRPRGGPPITS